MEIKLYEAGDNVKNYSSFESIELMAIMKDKNLSSKYELEFIGDNKEITRQLIWNIFDANNRINITCYLNNLQIIDNLKCDKNDFFSSIFYLINNEKCNISYFDKQLRFYFYELNLDYFINFMEV